jgi:hypothetical protein
MGATELEAQLREQIRWSMPTFDRMVFDDELTSEAA